MRRTETPEPIWITFCMAVDIADIVTYTNFGDHRLRGFWVAGGQNSPSPIDFRRRPYNTLALPCERVIGLTITRGMSDHGIVLIFHRFYNSFSTIRYEMRCYFNVRSEADMGQLNLPHGTKNNRKWKKN